MEFTDWWAQNKKSRDNPKGWTMKRFGQKLGRAQSIVSRILNKKHRPDPTTAVRMVIVTESAVSLDDIYGLPVKYRRR